MLLEILNSRAVSAYSRADFPTAVRFADEVLELAEESGNHVAAASALMIMGNTAHAHSAFDQAVMFHQAALAEAEQSRDPRLNQKIHGFLGYSNGRLGERALAIQHLQSAIEAAQQQGQPASATSWAFLLGRLMEERFSDPPEALEAYQKALRSLEEVREDRDLFEELAGPIGTLLDPQEVYRRAVRLAIQLGRLAQAFTVIEQSRSRQLLQLLSQSRLGAEERAHTPASPLALVGYGSASVVNVRPQENDQVRKAILLTELRRTEQRARRESFRLAGDSPEAQLRLAQPVEFDDLLSLIVR